jgi:hypothetical protein
MDRTRYAALKSHIQDIALQLTKITGTEWTLRRAEADETTYYHLDSGNADVYITEAYNAPNRIAINGSTPRDPKTGQYVHVYTQPAGWDEFKFSGITVSISKSAATIAGDIHRRFLPDYLKAVQLTVNRIKRDNQYRNNAQREKLEACASVLGVKLRSDYREVPGCDPIYEPVTEVRKYLNDVDSSGITVEITANATDVDLKLANLTVEKAKRILAFTQEMLEARNNYKGNLA